MRELLPLLQGPARYAGMEDGICVKESPTLRIALAFPDKYEVGMSYLGHKILYGIVNEREGWQAERVFAPDVDAAALLRKRGLPLCTLESDTPLGRVQAVGFAVTNELSFTNVLYMLDMGQIPLRQKDRPQDLASCPVIVIGGGAALGAEALAPFADLMCLGDGGKPAGSSGSSGKMPGGRAWARRVFAARRAPAGDLCALVFYGGQKRP